MIGNFLRISKLRIKGWIIEKGVTVQKGAQLSARKGIIRKDSFIGAGCRISGDYVEINENCLIYPNVDIMVLGEFKLGRRSKISRNVTVRAHDVNIGEEFWCNENAEVGGGGWMKPTAKLTVGDHVHMGKGCSVNVCESVTIGSCTGIGIECMVFTHSSGNGQSILDGYKHIEMPVTIGNHVSLFTRVMVAPGVVIHDGATLGAMSYVNSEVSENSLYAGVPAKEKKKTEPVDREKKTGLLINELSQEIKYPVDGTPTNGGEDRVLVTDTLTDALLERIKGKGYKAVVCLEDISSECPTEDFAIFCIEKAAVYGRSSRVSEAVRDALRRNGMLFDYADGYVPNKLDALLFVKKGIEIM